MAATRDELIAAIADAVSEFQDATDEVDEAAADRLGINRTDLRCLGLLSRRGPLTAGELAGAIGLTSGATTTAIDRLNRKGYVQRVRDDQDRRRVTIRLAPATAAAIASIWGPIGEEGARHLRRRTRDELAAIHRFLLEGTNLQTAHAERIRRGE